MPFVEQAIGDAQEQQPVPEGRYDLRAESCTDKENQETGRTSYEIVLKIENPPEEVKSPMDIFFYLPMVKEDDSDKARAFLLLQQKRFFEAFSVPYEATGFDPDDIPGSTAGNIHVIPAEFEGRKKNEINLPPAPMEDGDSMKKSGGKRRRRA